MDIYKCICRPLLTIGDTKLPAPRVKVEVESGVVPLSSFVTVLVFSFAVVVGTTMPIAVESLEYLSHHVHYVVWRARVPPQLSQHSAV